jgi:protein-S-isoprenylcysteine O-methyltransferase Ste14
MSTAQQGNSRNPLQLLMRVPVPWVFVLTYLAGVGLGYAWPLDAAAGAAPGLSAAGGALLGVGAALAGWGLVTFLRARTTTVPGRASSRLVTWGPYRFSRNPMYVGLTLAYLGEAGVLRQVWPVLLLPLTVAYVNWVVIPVEEAKLKEVFGDEYEQYRASVRRWV